MKTKFKNTRYIIQQWWVKIILFILVLYFLDEIVFTNYKNTFLNFTFFSFISVLVSTFFITFIINKKDLLFFGIRWDKFSFKYICFGAVLPLFYFLVLFFIYLTIDELKINNFYFESFFKFSLSLFFIATYEELIYRGIVFQLLIERFNPYLISIILSLIFALVHANNPNIGTMELINIFLAGLMLSISYIHTRSLWFAISFHFIWNLSQHLFLGSPISGMSFGYEIIEYDVFYDNQWYNILIGTEFGIEGSIMTSIFLIFCIYYIFKKITPSPYQSAIYFKNKYELSKNIKN